MAILSSDQIGLLFTARGNTDDARVAFKKLRNQIDDDTKHIQAGPTNVFISLAKAIGLSDAQIVKLGSNLPIVGGIIVGVVGAAVGLAATMVKLANDTADVGSQVHDLSERLGISTEAISSLKVAADQSDTSIESLAGGIQKFTLLLAEGEKGSQKAKNTLSDLHVTSNNLETAFAQVVKRIYELPPGLDQNSAAADAFGKKMGGQLIPLINQFHGDLPGLIAESKRLGLTWSKEDADAADNLGDQTVILQKQLKGLEITIGKELIPTVTKWTTQLSSWLTQNKGEVASWAKGIGDALDEIVQKFKSDKSDLDALTRFFEDTGDVLNPNVSNEELKQKRAQRAYAARIAALPTATYNQPAIDYTRPGDKPPGYNSEEARRKEQEEEEKAQKERERLYQERLSSLSSYYSTLIDQTHEAYTTQQKLLEEAFKNGEITDEQYRVSARRTISAFYDFVSDKINKQEQIEIGQAKNEVDRETAHLEKVKATAALKTTLKEDSVNVDKAIDSQQKKLHDQELKRESEEIETLNKLLDAWSDYGETVQSVLDRVNAGLEKWQRLRQEAEQRTYETLKAERQLADFRSEQQRKILQNTVDASRGEARQLALEELRNFEIAEADRKRQNDLADLEREKKLALESVKGKENEEEQKFQIEELYRQRRALSEEEFKERLREIVQATTSDGGGLFEQWTQSWKKFFDLVSGQAPTLQTVLGGMANILQRAFQGVANAVGNVVSNWVLYGKTGPAVMRMILAQALASIAAEAAVRAIFELAAGFAALFFNPAEAAAHFTAAALYGTIAVGAALAGRAVAGNAFNQQNQGAFGNAGATGTGNQNRDTSGQGSVYSSQPDQVVDVSRNTPFGSQAPIVAHIKIGLDSNGILRFLRDDVERGGPTRGLIIDTATGG